MTINRMKMHSVLFHRDFRGFTGGHLKVWHYFNHVRHSPDYVPYAYFSKETIWDESNPWLDLKAQALASWHAIRPDVLCLAGVDWLVLSEDQRGDCSVPVINLILGMRHAQPEDIRYSFLKNKAIRICISEDVGIALRETHQVNGPLFVIPGSIDAQDFPKPRESSEKDYDLLIVAKKQPELGLELLRRLERSDRRIEILTTHLFSRSDFLSQVNRAKITVFVPTANPYEGFHLPALEGMAMGTLVVCPDCIGNRSFCLPGYNCFRPEFTLEGILKAAEAALQLPPTQMRQMLANATMTVAKHELMNERKAFLNILENVSQIY